MISVDIDDNRFNFRVAGIAIKENKIMLNKVKEQDYWFIPGGRIEGGEDSKNAIRREMKEKIDQNIIIEKYMFTIENFFQENDKKYHELGIYYHINVPEIWDGIKTINEAGTIIEYKWIDIDSLNNINVYPEIIKQIVKYEIKKPHFITYDDNDNVILTEASIEDVYIIYEMQKESFIPLLNKYNDIETNPASENIDKIINRINDQNSKYHLINYNDVPVGVIRIQKINNNEIYRISPIFIIPQYQNRGIAQKVLTIIEEIYKPQKKWVLSTISEEKNNCHLYEKYGYKPTGKLVKINEDMNIIYYEKIINSA